LSLSGKRNLDFVQLIHKQPEELVVYRWRNFST